MVVIPKKTIYDMPMRIRFRGEYDYDGLFALIRQFYKDSLFNLKEPKLKYKVKKTGAEVEFKFISDRKVSHYIKVFLDVRGKLWDVNRNEKGLTKGKLEIKINATYLLNYEKTFNKSSAMERWMQAKLDSEGTGLKFGDNRAQGKKYLEKLTQDLQLKIKKHLKMECV